MEGSCAAFDHNWNIVILTQGKHKIGNTYLTEAYCLNACLYYPEKTTGCEYKKSTKECWVHTKKIYYGRGEGGKNGIRCTIWTPELEGVDYQPCKELPIEIFLL